MMMNVLWRDAVDKVGRGKDLRFNTPSLVRKSIPTLSLGPMIAEGLRLALLFVAS